MQNANSQASTLVFTLTDFECDWKSARVKMSVPVLKQRHQ